MNNTILNLTPEDKILDWKNVILDELNMDSTIHYIMDTETTGLYARGSKIDGYIRDRVIEIGVIVGVQKDKSEDINILVDNNGDQIFFHEYINFLRETEAELLTYNSRRYIPKDVKDITGISENILFGLEKLPGTDIVLSEETPTFGEIFVFIENFLILNEVNKYPGKVKMVAHNADFDYSFLNEEMQKINQPPIESFIEKVDTRTMAQEIVKKIDFENKNKQSLNKHNRLKTIAKKHPEKFLKNMNYLKELERILENKLEEKILSEKRKTSKTNKTSESTVYLKLIKTNNGDYSYDYIESLLTMKNDLLFVKNYSLDHLSLLLNVKIERTLHGALLDSKILSMVYFKLLKLDGYRMAKNNPNKKYKEIEKIKLDF